LIGLLTFVIVDRVACNRLVSLGSQQYLKGRFGKGYSLTFSVVPGYEQQAIGWLRTVYPTAEIDSSYNGLFSLVIPMSDCDVAQLFNLMRLHRAQHGIKEWGLNQSSLEDVFLRIVRRDEGMSGAAPE
jgi:hypothetical protein